MPVNPFLLRILKTCEARTLLLGIGMFATLLFSGCANGGVGERASSGASFISASDRRQDSFGMGNAAQNSAIVDWSKPATDQPGTCPRSTAVEGNLHTTTAILESKEKLPHSIREQVNQHDFGCGVTCG